MAQLEKLQQYLRQSGCLFLRMNIMDLHNLNQLLRDTIIGKARFEFTQKSRSMGKNYSGKLILSEWLL